MVCLLQRQDLAGLLRREILKHRPHAVRNRPPPGPAKAVEATSARARVNVNPIIAVFFIFRSFL
ncbi:MAG: hypothetical protein MZV70_75065 [Desulfobacterales bacterium]|nr:hypothetical protein [Desulfobacterales bacterium]